MNFLPSARAILKTSVALLAIAAIVSVPLFAQGNKPAVQDGTTLNAIKGDGQNIALPLVSIGQAVGWKIPADDYRINVPAAADGRETSIEVFSPEINRNDYANARDRLTYYGDELYGKNATLQTQFKLTNPEQQTLFDRSFGTGTQHGYEAFYQGTLPAGVYPFRVASVGNGKNSFALRATNGLRIEASQFTVNARGQFNQDQLVAFVQIDKSAIGKTVELSNYDADGNQEVVLTLVAPDGRRFALTASEDTKWASNFFKVDSSLLGDWKILARVLPTTRQFSNSFAVRVRFEDRALFAFLPGFQTTRAPVEPLKVDVVDTQGNPIPGSSYVVTGVSGQRIAQPVLPECWTPVSANILAGQGLVASKTSVSITSDSGSIRFVADCPKANIAVTAVALVCGQVLPLSNVGFSIQGQALTGKTPSTISLEPGQITVVGATLTGATSSPVIVTAERGKTVNARLEYSPSLKLELQPSSLDLAIGDVATIIATASSEFATGIPTNLNLQLPDGLEALGAITRSGQVSATTPIILRLRVKANKPIAASTIRAALEPNCGIVAVAQVRVLEPAPPVLTLTKTVDKDLVRPSNKITYSIVVANTGSSAARNINLTDLLPSNLTGTDLLQTFDLLPNQSRTFKISATVAATAPAGEIINTARVTWTGKPLEASAVIRVEVVPPVLTLRKTVDKNLVKPNDRANYTIVVGNTGGSTASNVRLTDILPTGVSGSNLDQTFDLAVGQSKTFNLPVVVTRATAGEIINTASLTWSGQPLSSSATIRVEAPQARLTLTKTVDRDVVQPGEPVNFTIVVGNTGEGVARDLRLTDALPTGLTGTNLDQSFTLQPGQSRTFRIPATVASNALGELTNIARVTWSGEPLSAAATVRVQASPAVLSLTKSVDRDVVKPNDRANYIITVSNSGGSLASNILLTDVLPDGVSGTNLSQSFDLAAGQTRTFRIPVIVTRASTGEIVNTANLTWNGTPLTASARIRVEVPVVIPAPPILALTKVADKDLVAIGDTVNFTIIVTNTGGSTASNVRLTDNLPNGLSGNNLSQTFDLQAGQSRTVSLPAVVNLSALGEVVNTANVTWSGAPLAASARVRVQPVVVVPQAAPQTDLSITKRALLANLKPDEATTFLITVSNNGPDTATGVLVSDPLPSGLEYETASTSQGEVSFTNGVLTANLGSLASGRSATINLRAVARAIGTLTNTASVSGDQAEVTLENNRASAEVVVSPVIDLVLSKNVTPTQTGINQPVDYRLVVRNDGPSDASQVVLTDPIPEGLVYVSANISQGTVRFDGGTVTASLGAIAVGQSATVTIRATTTRAGTFQNTANVRANEDETRLDNNSASAEVIVTAPIIRTDVAITKAVSPTRLAVGQSALYTIVVRNNGPEAATEVTMSDPIPAGLDYVAATSTQGTVSLVSGNVVVAIGKLAVGASATVTVRVVTTRAGRFNNIAATNGKETETRLDNNSASAEIEVFLPTGFINVTAASLICGTRSPISATGFSIGATRYTTPARIELPIGDYSLQPDALPGSSSTPIKISINANQNTSSELVYNVQTRVEINPNTVFIVSGQNSTIRAVASTAFPYPVPISLQVRLPEQLTPSGAVSSNGVIQAGQPLVFTVPVRALRPVAVANIQASLEPNCNVADVGFVQVTGTPLPPQRRETQVVLLAKLAEMPALGSSLILSDKIPAGSSYIAGSSSQVANPTFNNNTPTTAVGAAIADPFIVGDRLFWVVPVSNSSVYGITYRLAHTGALQMPDDRVAAFLAIPNSRSANVPRTGVAIDPNSPMGKLVGQGELRVLQGDPSLLAVLAKALPFSATSIAVRPVGGAASSLRVSAVRPTTDAADQPTIKIEAFDQNGLPARDEFATIQTNADPADPDAAPSLAGYQVRLNNGVGYLRLQSLTSNALGTLPLQDLRFEARVVNDNGVISSSQTFKTADFSVLAANPIAPNSAQVQSTDRPVIAVGLLSGQVRYDFGTGNFTADGGLRFFLRGTVIAGTTFTVGINWQADYDPQNALAFRLSGQLMPPANPYYYLPLLGDSSVLGTDVRSTEGFYARLEGGNSFIMFGQFNPQFQGTLSNYNQTYNGIQGAVRTGGFSLTGFATDAPNSNKSVRLAANGIDLYFLPDTNINTNSEQIAVVVYSKNDAALRIARKLLVRNTDYTIDYETGILRLTKAVTSTDLNLNPQFIESSYGTANVGRDFRFGAQAALGSPEFNVTATAIQFRNGTLGANSSLLLGGGINITTGGFQFGAEVASSGVFGDPANSNLGVGAQLAWTIGSGFQLRGRYQDLLLGYVDPETNTPASAGRSLTAGLVLGNPNGFRINANLDHNQSYISNSGATNASAEARWGLGDGWSVGVGLQGRYSFPSDLFELFGTAGLEANLGGLRLGLLQRVPLLGIPGSYGNTEASLELPLGAGFSVLFKDKLTYAYNGINQQISFGVKGAFTNAELLRVFAGNTAIVPADFGTTNVSATYDLSTVDGNAGRARLGVDTIIPIGGALSTQLGGEIVFDPTASTTGSISLGLLFSDPNFKGLARAQLSYSPIAIRQVYTAGFIAQLGDEFVISPKIEYATDPSKAGKPTGLEFSVAAAYRGDDLSILTNHRAKTGLYTLTNDYVEGEIQFGYAANERLFARLGAQYRYELDASSVFTGLVSGGFTYFLTDTFAVGAQAGYYFQPATSFSQVGFGVEASLKVFDRLLLTLGYNVLGFNGALGNAFRPGLYFRFDWKIDDNMFR